MALSDFLSLVDAKLHDVFHHTAPDPTKARKPFIKKIDATIKQFSEGKQPRGADKWWSANNNVVMFSPTLDGREIKIGKVYPLPIPAERFADALNHLKASVDAGELDDQLVGDGTEAPVKATKKRAAPAGESGRAGWTPARHAKFKESVEARRKAKEAAAAKAK
jgi:hypothetical protein